MRGGYLSVRREYHGRDPLTLTCRLSEAHVLRFLPLRLLGTKFWDIGRGLSSGSR